MFWCWQHKYHVNPKAKTAQPFVGAQGKWEQLLTPAAWCFPFHLSCRTRAAIKACSVLHQSLLPTKGNKLYPNKQKCTWGYFSFKIMLAVDYTSHLPRPVNSILALHLALWNRHTCSLNSYKTIPCLWLYFTSYSPACHVPSPCLLKESTPGMGHTCLFYKKDKGKFQL